MTWKSSNAAIASVDANGKVTGVKAGEATITVTTEDGGKTATCKVTVSDKEIKVTGVKLNKSETSLLVGGNETPYRYCPSRRRHQPKCNVEIG